MNITREQFKKLAKKHLTAFKGYDINETTEIYGVEKLYDDIVKSGRTDINTEKVTRVDVIDDTGLVYVNWKLTNVVEIQLLDCGETMKLYISDKNQKK